VIPPTRAPDGDGETHGTTVVDPVGHASFPDGSIAPWTEGSFRALASESRQTPMDLHLRRRLWWLSSMTLVLSHRRWHRRS